MANSNDSNDYRFMAHALRLARRGLYSCDPNPRVGCVLVKNGIVVGEGWHVRTGAHHAEIHALNNAGAKAKASTAYITLEPCCHYGRTPPCTDALLEAGIIRVVAAMQDPDRRVAGRGFDQLREAGVEVEIGVMQSQARALNIGYIQRQERARPWLRCKLAMSLDGRTAMASGESRWITGPAARLDVQRLRARSSAIMTGVATVISDNPSLNVRLDGVSERQPLRVILDSDLKTPPSARILGLPGKTLILTGPVGGENANRAALLQAAGAEIFALARNENAPGIDLHAVMRELASREINEIHLECGRTLAGAFLNAGLLDELILYMAPIIMGDNAYGLFKLPLQEMAGRIELALSEVRAIGCDWRICARPLYQPSDSDR